MALNQGKVLIATGGTGGHVFPAQALGTELMEMGYEVLFVGGGLESNRYFNRERFSYRQIASATPFKGNFFKSLYHMGKGIWQSLKVLGQFQPDIVIGFGSYHSFPVLCAASWKKISIALFVPDAIPGRVNRFFAKKALFSAVQFNTAGQQLGGNIIEVKMPMINKKQHDPAAARDYFYLDPGLFTFFVFGGSQGSESINTLFSKSIEKVAAPQTFQVIHVAGKSQSAERIRRQYEQAGIRACVKVFEERMDLAWSAANAVVCRSGAAALAEMLTFGVPGILIPFPQAADDHQTKNALFIEKNVGGAIACPESSLSVDRLKELLEQFMLPEQLTQMKAAMASFKQDQSKPALSTLICDTLAKRSL